MPDISKLSGALIDSVGKVDGVLKESIASIAGVTFPQGSLILDQYSGAVAAYSVRKLRYLYAGSALRVRRTVSPFDEQDIGYDSNGDLDTAAIVSFGGSDPLTVSVWYDQSGSGNDATQTTATDQKQIYNGTAVLTKNGKPHLIGGGTISFNTALNAIPQPYTVSYVHSNQNIYAKHLPIGSGNQLYRIQSTNYFWLGVNVGAAVTTTNNQQMYFFGLGDGANGFGKISTPTAQAASVSVTTAQNLDMSQLFSFRSQPQEFIVWGADHGSAQAAIELEANTYYSIY